MKAIAAAALFCSVIALPLFNETLHAQESNPYERIAEPMAPRNIQILLEKEAIGSSARSERPLLHLQSP